MECLKLFGPDSQGGCRSIMGIFGTDVSCPKGVRFFRTLVDETPRPAAQSHDLRVISHCVVFIGQMTDAHLNEDLVNNHQQSFLNVNTQIMFFGKLEFQFNVPWEAWDIDGPRRFDRVAMAYDAPEDVAGLKRRRAGGGCG